MKAGTTLLARYLDDLPTAFLARGKELHFFDRHFDRGVEWYAAHFADAAEPVVGEATPNYLHDIETPGRMHSVIPSVKLVVTVRNPVERAYSHYWHERARGRETLSFEEAIAEEESRLATGDPFHFVHHSYLERGRYLPQLERYERLFGRAAMCVLLLEELERAPERALEPLHTHLGLGVPPRPLPSGRVNAYVEFRSLALRRWSARRKHPAIRVVRRLNARKTRYPPMSPELRARLMRELSSENRALSEWLGRDVSEFWR